jgi:hypothetical protein
MVKRMDLIDAMVSRDVEAMDMKDLIRLAYEVFEERFESYSDEELREHAADNYPELLEELDRVSHAN